MSSPTSALQRHPDYEVVIGIEVHVQLLTQSKIFCSCLNSTSQEPNTNICPICTGHPGVLPVLNNHVITHAIRAGLATNCHIAKQSVFDRKHYFYPDLPKGYQITQQYKPICTEGFLLIQTDEGHEKKIRINRIHIEEDAGKNIHSAISNESFVDLNRAGTPLLEIVSYPDIASAQEAKNYLKKLRSLVQHLGICSGSMEEGAFRADTNISVRKKDVTALGTKCELKNINSFKFISDAIEHEIERQIVLLESGKPIIQETRLWDSKNRKTVSMRSKEEAADYRYLPDPDLPHIEISTSQIDLIRSEMPELPDDKNKRFITHYHLTPAQADTVVEDKDLAHYYEETMHCFSHETVINWILRDVLGYLKEHSLSLDQFLVTPSKLASLINMVTTGQINNRTAQELFIDCAQSGKDPAALVSEKGLSQIGSFGELEKIVDDTIKTYPDVMRDCKNGKEKLLGFLVGQAMKLTAGKGNPKIIQDIFKKKLEEKD